MTEPSDGTLRIFHDVVVQQSHGDEWIAIGRESALSGETLVLDVAMLDADLGELHRRFAVCVIDSEPVIVDGAVRHRIRLQGGDLATILFEQQVRRG